MTPVIRSAWPVAERRAPTSIRERVGRAV
jgi:hypothetical protein